MAIDNFKVLYNHFHEELWHKIKSFLLKGRDPNCCFQECLFVCVLEICFCEEAFVRESD
jgi:hypothetical protein